MLEVYVQKCAFRMDNMDAYNKLYLPEIFERIRDLSVEGLSFLIGDGVVVESLSAAALERQLEGPDEKQQHDFPHGPWTVHFDLRPVQYVFNGSRNDFIWDSVQAGNRRLPLDSANDNQQEPVQTRTGEIKGLEWIYIDGINQDRLLAQFQRQSRSLPPPDVSQILQASTEPSKLPMCMLASETRSEELHFTGIRHYFERSVHSKLSLLQIGRALGTTLTVGGVPLYYFEVTFHVGATHRRWTTKRELQEEEMDDYDDSEDEREGIEGFDVTYGSQEPRRFRLNAAIGLVEADYPNYNFPGYVRHSAAYHSSTGNVLVGRQKGESFQFGPTWREGDTIGCGYLPLGPAEGEDPESSPFGVIFFTKNGGWVGDVPQRIKVNERMEHRHVYHPSVGCSDPAVATFNLGGPNQKPFMYQPANRQTCSGTSPQLARYFARQPTDEQVECIQRLGTAAYTLIPTTPKPTTDRRPSCTVHRIADTNEEGVRPTLGLQQVIFPAIGYQYPRNVQAAYPLLAPTSENPQSGYFEATIVSGRPEEGFVSIGLSWRPATCFYHVGWDFGAVGYHS
ncbi:Rsp5p-dependent ubiquitination, sorting of cargo proteins at the multivesicular body [Chytridiales sp. JEL 0842]|nr:Rsp5p-dependent ubiquitination, sorting of cargo proteins at the multivesicular body [Chytridiales sp. JEL 0842]